MNSSIYFPIILQILGCLVIVAEVIVPSGGVLGILSVGLIGYSLYLVFANFSSQVGLLFLLIDLISIPLLVYFAFKILARSPVTLHTILSREKGVTSQDPELNSLLGQTGKALSALRPSGLALFEEKRLDVVSRGEYLEKGCPVIIIAIRGNQIVVKEHVAKQHNSDMV